MIGSRRVRKSPTHNHANLRLQAFSLRPPLVRGASREEVRASNEMEYFRSFDLKICRFSDNIDEFESI